MLKLDEILRSLSEPLSPERLVQLRDLLPRLEEQRRISQERLDRVTQVPSARRKTSRYVERPESQRDAVREIGAYLMSVELTISRVRDLISLGAKLHESRTFTAHIKEEK
ncbi:MAG: hypothetical protein H0X24_20440 [Ktedonobacterales bacterium]|nr:hypothetical protein [Ktedonobacterales bacterium]